MFELLNGSTGKVFYVLKILREQKNVQIYVGIEPLNALAMWTNHENKAWNDVTEMDTHAAS